MFETLSARGRAFWVDEAGTTAIEYGLLIGLLALVLVTAASHAGSALQARFVRLGNALG